MKLSPPRYRALLASVLSFSFVACTMAQRAPSKETDYGQVAAWVTHLLQEQHYSKQDFNDDMSRKALKGYMEFLDYDKMYFLKEEVESFTKKYSDKLDDFVFTNDLTPANEIYKTYSKHVQERYEKIKALLETPGKLEFTGSGTTQINRKDAAYSATIEEADALWKSRLTNDVLAERLRLTLAEEKKKEKAAEPKSKEGDKAANGEAKEAPKKSPAPTPDTPEQKILKRYKRLLDTIMENDEEDVANYFLSSISQAYDPHSEYFSAPEKENFDIEMNKRLQGIGAVLSMRDGAAEIERLVGGAPAHLSGELKVHDRIVGVAQGMDGEMEDVEGMKLNKVVEKVRGDEGSIVRLKVIPADDPTSFKEVVLKRAKVELKESLAKADLIEGKDSKGELKRIGWISIDSFYADMEHHTVSLTRDVKKLLQRLMKENISGLVIDLRGNGGGSLEEAISLTGLFIKKGPVVQQKSWNGAVDGRYSKAIEPLYTGPLCVLTDKTSASASEIFAAAMQDHGRAIVVGDKSTFGKGTVQTILDVSRYMPSISKSTRAGSLKVTIQKFYRVAGGSTQLKGVVPDLILPSRYEALEIGEEALKAPLPYDTIRKMDYDLAETAPMPANELRLKMDERLKSDPEFTYVREDVTRLKEQITKNTLSLNEQERLREIHTNKERNKQRATERKARIAEASKNGSPYQVYRLTLENVDAEGLTTLEKAKTDEKGSMISDSSDDEEDSDDKDVFPNDIEPVKAETLNIVKDLIQMTAQSRTAKNNQ
jgi:carboxyl-terminal processing protease